MRRMFQIIRTHKLGLSPFLQTRPVFLLLLPCFFVLHGYVANYNEVPAGDAVLLALVYTAIAFAIAGISRLFLQNFIKGCLFAFVIMTFHFFFGSIQDLLKKFWPDSFLLRYRFIFLLTFLFFVLAIIWLKKRKRALRPIITYLNTLLLLIMLADFGWLVIKAPSFRSDQPFDPIVEGFNICDTCYKPDIFFIIPDQYPGNEALKVIFDFDNAAFENELSARGFHIANGSNSNYNLTPFSVASTLNMNYIDVKKGAQNYGSVSYSYNLIRNNSVLKFLTASNYRFFNCSIFNFPGQPANEYGAFLPYGTKLITAQTFTGRLLRDFESDILAGKFGKHFQRKVAYEGQYFNESMLTLTREVAALKIPEPKFVYTHVMMPHYPYYFDSNDRPFHLEKLAGRRKAGDKDFIEYLKYTNKKILELIDQILASSPTPPVIMVLSDHGFRHIDMKTRSKYDFINLNAIYFPNKKYDGFYDSISNVNHFRVFLNTWFHTQLPLLQDSTINVIR